MNEKFLYLVWFSLEPLESESFTSLPSFLSHGKLKISKEESSGFLVFLLPLLLFYQTKQYHVQMLKLENLEIILLIHLFHLHLPLIIKI